MDSGENVTQMGWLRWIVEIQNRLTVWWEKRDAAERKEFKAAEEHMFNERKQALHKKTADQFGKAKMEVEAVRQANLTRGAEYKAELEEMKEMAAQQREEWMQFGHELTVQHGPEQMERTKARLAETAAGRGRSHRAARCRQRPQGAAEHRRPCQRAGFRAVHVRRPPGGELRLA